MEKKKAAVGTQLATGQAGRQHMAMGHDMVWRGLPCPFLPGGDQMDPMVQSG